MSKRVAYTMVREWLVVAFGSRPPAAPEWQDYATFLRGDFSRGKQRGILFSEGGSLEAYQRKELDEILGPDRARSRRIGVVTASTFTWGFVKALSLFDPSYQSFKPHELDRAMTYVELPSSSWDEARRVGADVRAQVG